MISVERLATAHVPGLIRCFERSYGSSYAVADFYSESRLRARIESGELRSVVALDLAGVVVGHTGLTVRPTPSGADSPRAAVAGNTVVDPECRGQGVLGRMGTALRDLCMAEGFVGYVHYPTAAHEIMQKRSVGQGGVETGVLLSYSPAGTEFRGLQRAAGRVAVTVVYQPFRAAPSRRVHLPGRYEQRLVELYRQAGLERSTIGSAGESESGATLSVRDDERRGVRTVAVERVGLDLVERLGELSKPQWLALELVDLPLADAGVSIAVERLANEGFVFGGLLPELGAGDLLRLQRIHRTEASTFRPKLVNRGAQQLLDSIRLEADPKNSGESN